MLLEDRYIDGTRLRLRRQTGADGTIWKLARKYGASVPGVEPMTNLYLSADEYALLSALPGADVVKRRWNVREEGVRFVVDRFEDALSGRIIAEVEAADPESLWALRPAAWCGREITGEAAFGGAALARDGWPTRG